MFERFRRDLHRHFLLDSKNGRPRLLEKLWIIANAPGVQALAVHRFGAWINAELTGRSVRYPFKAAYYALDKITVILWGVHIDEGADIGGGLYIPHVAGVLIGPVKMGQDCNVGPSVIIGRRTDGRGRDAVPTLGDRVWIGAGSVVFGGIVIGDGASIGPLTVVARNLPASCQVCGNPMQVLRREHDNSVQIYGKNGPPLESSSQPVSGLRKRPGAEMVAKIA
jgi:serine O-acetyltransferase